MTALTPPARPRAGQAFRHAPALAAAGLLALATVPSWAGPVGYTAWDVSGSDKLVRMDLASGVGTVIGSGIGFSDIDGLSFDGSGALWGVDDDTNKLVRIDTTTGIGTAVGAFGSGFNDMGLAFGGGVMYMAATNSVATIGSLYTVDTGTGAASLVGSFGGGLKVRSLGYYQDTLYGWSNVDTLVKINTGTGAATTVGPFSFASPTIGQDGFDIDPMTGIGWSIAEVENRTYSLSLGNGHATLAASSLSCDGGSCSAGGFNSLAIVAAPVPEPSTYALMGLGLLGIGLTARRRTAAARI